jgi:hypothetical protein
MAAFDFDSYRLDAAKKLVPRTINQNALVEDIDTSARTTRRRPCSVGAGDPQRVWAAHEPDRYG